MADRDEPVVANDHSALRDRPKRMWRFMELPLPGVSMPGVAAAGVVFFSILGLGSLTELVVSGNWPMYVAVIAGGAAGVGTYFAWGKSIGDRMPVTSYVVVWADWLLRQPRTIHGFGRDTEPADIQWQLILWHPTDPGWWAAHDHTLRWLRDHPTALSD